jgi:methionyl aminopeptidase
VSERGEIQLKTRGELQAMRASGLVLAAAIAAGRAAVAPGVSTGEIDEVIAGVIADAGATSNFLHYGGAPDGSGAFPATICASVNDEIVHGIPSRVRILREGDLLSIDAGCILDGWHSDSAISMHVGGVAPDAADGAAEADLIEATEAAMWAGIAAARAGGRLGDISWSIESSTKRSGSTDGRRYSLVAGYGGHGIGTRHAHGAVRRERGPPGQGRAAGSGHGPGDRAHAVPGPPCQPRARRRVDRGHQGWRAGRALFEHSIAITSDGVSVLTAADRGTAGLAGYGITPVDLG